MKKIFIVSYGGAHANIITTLYPKLSDKYEVVILALTTSKDYFKKNGVPYQTLSDYFKEEPNFEILNQFNENIERDFKDKESLLYHSIGIQELIKIKGFEIAKQNFNKIGRMAFLPIEAMKIILKKEKPSLVFVTDAPRYEKACLLAAQELGIKNISIENLFGNLGLIKKNRDYLDISKYESVTGDFVCVLNEYAKKNLVLRGVKEDKIIITGNPVFDNLFNLSENKVLKKKEKDKITITYLTQPTENRISIAKELSKISFKKRYNLIIKLHPNEKLKDYDFLMKESNIKLMKDGLYDAINQSDIVIMEYSTTGIETCILEKDLINISLKSNEIFPFKELGLSEEVKNILDFESVIEFVLNDKCAKLKRMLARKKLGLKFGATDNVIKVIDKYMEA